MRSRAELTRRACNDHVPHLTSGERHDDDCSDAPNDGGDGSEQEGELAAPRARRRARASHRAPHSTPRARPPVTRCR
jgi:hypothetical protein